MSKVAIINQSTVITDRDGSIITSALNLLLPQFCKDWSLSPYTCVYVPKEKAIANTVVLKIFLLDTSDEETAVAYHTLLNDIPCGKAFAKTVLMNGGVKLYSSNPLTPTFAQAVCHELFEMIIDPHCNVWAMLADGNTQYAYEVCDPVESNAVTVNVQTGIVLSKKLFAKSRIPVYTKVGLSDWVLPKWFNTEATQATKGRFNHTNTLTAPFTVDKHGYVISLSNGTSKAIWGKSVCQEDQCAISKKSRVCCRVK